MLTNYICNEVPTLFPQVPTPCIMDQTMHEKIQYLLSQYCFCPSDLSPTASSTTHSEVADSDLVIKLPNRPIKVRKRQRLLHSRSVTYSITCLEHIINNTLDSGNIVIKKSKKSRNNSKVNSSTRRSHYIGVSKNGDVWQALIMIDKKKTYIGTYRTEVDAAKAYDFYAIALKHLSAKTNFDYTLNEIKNMVANYYTNQGTYVV